MGENSQEKSYNRNVKRRNRSRAEEGKNPLQSCGNRPLTRSVYFLLAKLDKGGMENLPCLYIYRLPGIILDRVNPLGARDMRLSRLLMQAKSFYL